MKNKRFRNCQGNHAATGVNDIKVAKKIKIKPRIMPYQVLYLQIKRPLYQ